jgi:hypothetical protein
MFTLVWADDSLTVAVKLCEAGWTPYQEHTCAKLINNTDACKTFSEAEAQCNEFGGNLVSVHSVQENAILTNLLNEASVDMAWLGGSTDTRKGTDSGAEWLTWIDGSAFDYGTVLGSYPWQAGEPHGGDSCLGFDGQDKWDGHNCDDATHCHTFCAVRAGDCDGELDLEFFFGETLPDESVALSSNPILDKVGRFAGPTVCSPCP